MTDTIHDELIPALVAAANDRGDQDTAVMLQFLAAERVRLTQQRDDAMTASPLFQTYSTREQAERDALRSQVMQLRTVVLAAEMVTARNACACADMPTLRAAIRGALDLVVPTPAGALVRPLLTRDTHKEALARAFAELDMGPAYADHWEGRDNSTERGATMTMREEYEDQAQTALATLEAAGALLVAPPPPPAPPA